MSSSSPLASPSRLTRSLSSGVIRTSHIQYSRRVQAHHQKRKAELENDETSDTEGSEAEASTRKRKRGAERSTSPTPKSGIKATGNAGLELRGGRKTLGREAEAANPSQRSVLAKGRQRVSARGLTTTATSGERDDTDHNDTKLEDPVKRSAGQGRKADVIPRPTTPTRTTSRDRPRTPQSSPRDLSALFSPLSDGSRPSLGSTKSFEGTPRRPGGLRRMLTKAQSLGDTLMSPSKRFDRETTPTRTHQPSSGPSTPTRLTPGRTLSLPVSPFASPGMAEDDPRSLLAVETARQETNGKVKRTYGKARTILEDTSNDDNLLMPTESMKEEMVIKQSYAELRRQYEVDNVMDDDAGSGNLMADLLQARAPQPVSDMRSKGENRQFMDEIGYLVDAVADSNSGRGLRRTSAMDILRNMQQDDWASRIYVCGQGENIWEALGKAREDDPEIMNAAALLYLALLIDAGAGIESILHNHAGEIVKLVLAHLKERSDVLDQPESSKQNAAQQLRSIFTEITVFEVSSFLQRSSRRLASFLLSHLYSQGLWGMTGTQLASPSASTTLIRAISTEVHTVADRFDMYSKGVDLIKDLTDFDPEHLHFLLVSLSASLLQGGIELETISSNRIPLLPALQHALIACGPLVRSSESSTAALASRCIIEILQIFACLAGLQPDTASELLSKPEPLRALCWVILQRDLVVSTAQNARPDESQSTEVSVSAVGLNEEDLLCFVLALLTTGANENDDVMYLFGNLSISHTCIVGHACIFKCRCRNARPFSEHLVQLYTDYRDVTDEGNRLIISGYIALLLSRILVAQVTDNPALVEALPGAHSRAKLEGLLASIGELEGVHSIVQRKLGELGPNEGMKDQDLLRRAMEDLQQLLVDI